MQGVGIHVGFSWGRDTEGYVARRSSNGCQWGGPEGPGGIV